MNSKGHLITSIAKSLFRLVGCLVLFIYTYLGDTLLGMRTFSLFFISAEILGIVEELVDRR